MIISEGYTINDVDIVSKGVTGLRLEQRVLAADELQIMIPEDVSATPWLAAGAAVVLKEHGTDTSDSSTWSEILFVGKMVERADDPVSGLVSYRCENAWSEINRVVFETDRSGDAANFARSHVILGRDGTTKLSTTSEITTALAWAKAVLSNSFDFTVSTGLPSVYPPPDEVVDLTCAEVVERMLRYVPYATTRWDYSQTPPHLYIEAADASSAQSLDLDVVSVAQCQISRRSDRDINGVRVYIERAHTVNGQFDSATVETQASGSTGGVGIVRHTIELEGKKEEKEFNTISIQRWYVWDAIELLEQIYPNMFNSEEYDYTNISTDLGAYALTPYVLLDGEYKDWMDASPSYADFANVALHIEYHQERKDGTQGKDFVQDISVPMIGGFGLSDGEETFERVLSTIAEESIGNIAARIYDARALLQYSGNLEILLQRGAIEFDGSRYPNQISVEGKLSDSVLECGKRINLSNGRPEWETMAALISGVGIDFLSRSVSYSIDPPATLSAGDLIAIERANRVRKKPTRELPTA